VVDFIADSLEENISLSQLAAIAAMSPHYFLQLFKQSTGHTPHSYVLLKGSNVLNKSFATPSAASSTRD
jgi:AraC family transcriptional regulator